VTDRLVQLIEGTVWGTLFRYKRFFVEETGCLAKSLIVLLTPKRWQPASLGFVNPLRILCLGKLINILDAPNLTLRGKVEKWDTPYTNSKLGAPDKLYGLGVARNVGRQLILMRNCVC